MSRRGRRPAGDRRAPAREALRPNRRARGSPGKAPGSPGKARPRDRQPAPRDDRRARTLGVLQLLARLSDLRLALLLAAAAFLVFNVNGREAYPTGDSRPTALLPLSLLYEGDLDLNEYHPPGAGISGPIRSENGRILSNYSPLPAFLSLPVYLPAWPHRAEIDGDIFRWVPFFSKLSGSLFAALAVGCFFLAAAQVASRRAALLSALALAFGGPFWMSASQTLGQHGLTALCSSLALLGIVRIERGGSWRWALLAGTAAAVAVGVRLSNVVIFACLLVYLLAFHRRRALAFAAPALIVAGPFAVLLLGMVGGAGGGLEKFAFVSRITVQFRGSIVAGLPGLLVSPGEGLFVWSPLSLLMLLPLASALRVTGKVPGSRAAAGAPRVPRRVLLLCAVTALSVLLLYACYVEWWGGRTYGPRYVTDALPFVLLPAAAGLERWLRVRVFWAAFVGLFLVSVYVQVLGAFRYPCRGLDPERLRYDHERVWDWNANDVVLCSESLRRPGQDLESAGRLLRMTVRRLLP